ncbi:acetyltransferase [bacterium]|nr:acetyltransferase [bacterium]
MSRLAILGASGHGKVVADTAMLTKRWDEVHFYDDTYLVGAKVEHWDILGDTNTLIHNYRLYDSFIVAIGDNSVRHKKHLIVESCGLSPAVLIHPNAIVSQYSSVGRGSVVFAGAIINAFSNVGITAIINTGATIDHDCSIGDAVHISPGVNLCGSVKVGNFSWICVGASIKPEVKIANNVTIGAGAVVINNVPDPGIYTGVPATKVYSL